MTKNQLPTEEFSPDELAAIHAELNARFTADDLYEYVEDIGERVPAAEVFERFKVELRKAAAERDGVKG